MFNFRTMKRTTALLLCAAACSALGVPAVAQDDADENPLVGMVVDLLGDSDRTMRALGLQQIREEAPGEAATKKFASLLPDLPAETQAELIEALGDRGDPAARPAVMEMLDSKEGGVRAAALKALGWLGSTDDAPMLAAKTVIGSDAEKAAARASLVRLRGEGVNDAIVTALTEGSPRIRTEMLGVLAARNAKEALPIVLLESTADIDSSVRVAALKALRMLTDESHTEAIVRTLKAAQTDAERYQAELALLVVCSRGREKCTGAIIAGMVGADPASKAALLRGLARAGGSEALDAIVARLEDDDETVRTEAVRMLAGWPDDTAASQLQMIAESQAPLRDRVLALRGLVRLAAPKEDQAADLKTLAEVMALAERPDEKRLVLGVLGGIGSADALEMALSAADDQEVAEEAALALVLIAEKMEGGDQDKVRAAVEKAQKVAKNQQTLDRAKKVLESL